MRAKGLVLVTAVLLLLLARPARSDSVYDYAVYEVVYLYIDDPEGTGKYWSHGPDWDSRGSMKTRCAVWEGVCTFSGTLEGSTQFRLIPHEVYDRSTARATGSYWLGTAHSLCTGIWTSAEPGYKVLNETYFWLRYPYSSDSAPIEHRFTSTLDSWYSYRPYDSARVNNFKGHWTALGAFSRGSWLKVTVYSAKVRFEYFVYTGFRGSYAKPPQKVKLTVQVYRATASGPTTTPANGTLLKIGNTVYTADSSGKVAVEVDKGSTVSVQVLDTYYGQNLNVYWRRYTFWKWSDGSTSNPRSFTVSQDTTVIAYVWDERLLLVLYEPRYGSDPWGVKALQLPDRYASYVGQMLPWNASFWMRTGESFALQAVEGGAARFLRWDTATECYPRNPYSVDPIISLTIGSYGLAVRAVFRLGPSNQTMYLPGEGVPVPVFWPVYQQHAMGGCDGRKGTWLLNVSALTSQAQTAFNLDNRTWIYALLVNPSSILQSAWVPVNGSWKLYMDRDWDALAHKLDDCTLDNPYADACRYVAYDANSVSDFPQVVSGAPSKYRGWRLVALAAWKPLLPGESYSAGAVSAVWLGNGSTLALYNVTFKHVDSGWVYWQPVAVSALKVESATARYKLSSYDGQLRRSPIYMWIEAVVDWKYVPPNSTLPSLPPNVTLWMAGFKPHRIGNVGVALENDAGVVVWAPRGSAYGGTGKLYTLSIGDTELFYREPRGLNFGKRDFKLVARFVARAGQPGVRVDDGVPVKAEVSFTLAPSIAVIADWLGNDPWKLVVDWDCFTSGSLPLSRARMNVRYLADFYYEWGPVDPYNGTLPPLGRKLLNSVYPTVLVSDVDPDYWVAFYPIPAGNQYAIAQGAAVPVPLPAKYPPRAKGG